MPPHPLRPRRAAALLCLWAALALALPFEADAQDGDDPINDYLIAPHDLDDDAFYRLVSCAAPPGRPCQTRPVRWPRAQARDLTVSLTRVDRPHDAARASRALDAAIAEINAAGARIALRRIADGAAANIRLHLLNIPERQPMRGTGVPGLEGRMIDGAVVWVWWNGWQHITRAEIVLSTSIHAADYRSVVLEELTQSLGLMYDIGGRHYQHRSIFARDSNSRTTLGRQDIAALRRHYPGR